MNAVRAAGMVLALALANGCSRSPWVMPDGVITTGADRQKAVVDGIYPVTTPNDACCWVQRRSSFRIAPPDGMTDLAIQLFVPDIPLFRTRPRGWS